MEITPRGSNGFARHARATGVTGSRDGARRGLVIVLVGLAVAVFAFVFHSSSPDLVRPTEVPAERPVSLSSSDLKGLAFLASRRPRATGVPEAVPILGDNFYLSGLYGWRTNPVTGEGREFHSGLDFAATKGTLVIAPSPGLVTGSFSDPYLGEAVRIDHGDGVETLYAHLDARFVESGARVAKGEALGRVGYTGRSTGAHLHYAVYREGKPLDPLLYLWDSVAGKLAMR